MIIELATLPPMVQQYIQQNPSVELNLINGQVVATPKQRLERPFNFDIEEMDKAIHGKFVEMPKGMAKDLDTFTKWLDGEFA